MARRWLAGLALLALLASGCARVPVAPPYLWPGDQPAQAPRPDLGWLVARRENLDPELREWVDRSLSIPSAQILSRGDWAYALVTWAPPGGLRPVVADVTRENGGMAVLVDFVPSGDGDPGYALAVIRHGGSPVDIRHAGGVWLIPRLEPHHVRQPSATLEGVHLFEPSAGSRVGPLIRISGLARTRVTYQLIRPAEGDGEEEVLAEGVAAERADPWTWTPFTVDAAVPLPGYSPEMEDAPLFPLLLRAHAQGSSMDIPVLAHGAVRVLAYPAPVMSPDGFFLAYVLPGTDGTHRLGVWTAGLPWPDDALFTLPRGETVTGPMSFNPASPLLAFVTAAGDGWRLYLLDHRAAEATVLEHLDALPSGMTWSPDGRYLLWYSPPVWYDMATRRSQDLTPLLIGDEGDGNGEARAFLLSSFGTRLAYSLFQDGGEDLWVLDLHVGQRERVTDGGVGGYPEAWLSQDAALVFTAGALHQEWEQGLSMARGGETAELFPSGRGQTFHLAGADPDGRFLVVGAHGRATDTAVLLLDMEGGATWQVFDDMTPRRAVFYEEGGTLMALLHAVAGPTEQLWALDLHTMGAHLVLERDRPLNILAVVPPHAYFTEREPYEPVDAVSIGRINLLTGHLRWIR